MDKNGDERSSWAKTSSDIGPYLGLGTQLAATIILMFFLGRWLDSKFDTEPILTVLFAFLGGAAGTYNFIRIALELNKKEKKDDTKSQSKK